MNEDGTSKVQHVSDTALLVAAYRAMETRRKDALFQDPYAEGLAGERGKEITMTLERGKGAWATVARTVALDQMIRQAIEDGADTVMNLAAGLDTRPYRLDVPVSLRWIEVDFPSLIEYKTEKLAGEEPRCGLERVPLDLADRGGRKELFDRVNSEGKSVLVVSEGLLVYLTEDEVVSFAQDLHAEPNFAWWIADVATPGLLEVAQRQSFTALRAGDVRVHFGTDPESGFFERHGWNITTIQAMSDVSWRIKREPSWPWFVRMVRIALPRLMRQRQQRSDSNFLLMQRQ